MGRGAEVNDFFFTMNPNFKYFFLLGWGAKGGGLQ